ncbi:hypothetical protein BDZ91DRAFT_763999 [Kalaharituber pfeilii]|nr:hypothetical protein BDZ91DRAFT_763999 [Kalaharituber pfeilii]
MHHIHIQRLTTELHPISIDSGVMVAPECGVSLHNAESSQISQISKVYKASSSQEIRIWPYCKILPFAYRVIAPLLPHLSKKIGFCDDKPSCYISVGQDSIISFTERILVKPSPKRGEIYSRTGKIVKETGDIRMLITNVLILSRFMAKLTHALASLQ